MIVDLPAKFGSSGIIRFEICRQKAKWGLKTSAHPQKPKIAKTRKWFCLQEGIFKILLLYVRFSPRDYHKTAKLQKSV
jgi:hypothetical protein